MLKPYQKKLKTIEKDIEEIGLSISRSLEASLQESNNNNIENFSNISVGANKISQRMSKINNLIINTLSLYSPEARDLRRLIAFLKISNEFERAASNLKDFLKIFRKLYSKDLHADNILKYTIFLLEFSMSSFVTSVSIIYEKNEKQIDIMFQEIYVEKKKGQDLYQIAEKNILKLMSKNVNYSKNYFNLLIGLKKLEKISNRSVCIAKLLRFAQTGK